jgi:hypothetical protein
VANVQPIHIEAKDNVPPPFGTLECIVPGLSPTNGNILDLVSSRLVNMIEIAINRLDVIMVKVIVAGGNHFCF